MEKDLSFNQNDLPFWVGFNFFEGIGSLRFKLLLDYFGSAQKAWSASRKELIEIGLGRKLTDKFLKFRRIFDPNQIKIENNLLLKFPNEGQQKYFWRVQPAKQYQRLDSGPIFVLSWMDDLYPERLRQIDASPPLIYFKTYGLDNAVKKVGKLFKKPAIAVVGTRRVTNYGRRVTEKLVQDLIAAGMVIVSGMARGVDGVAHRTALKDNGQTVAVLGSGVDVVYPFENKDVYLSLTSGGSFRGLVVSEFPPGFPPLPGNFPARNRIIAGLSDAVLVTEAAERSGSLITARLAAEQGKDVFAVPGPITSHFSNGSAYLIKQGAKLVSSAEDVLEEMRIGANKPG